MDVYFPEDCVSKFNNLLDPTVPDVELVQTIRSLSDAVSYDPSALSYAVRHVRSDVLFELLSSNSISRQVQSPTEIMALMSQLCTIFRKVMDSLEPEFILENYLNSIVSSSSSIFLEFQLACMQLVLRMAENENVANQLCNTESAVHFLIRQVGEGPLSVATVGRKALNLLFGHAGDDVTWFLTPSVKVICSSLEKADTTGVAMFRVTELFVDLVILYPKVLEECSAFGAFDYLLRALSSTDVLSQLNVLEMICCFADCGILGLQFIQKNGLLDWAASYIQSSDDALMTFLIPGAVKFFGRVAHNFPTDVIPSYRSILSFVILNTDSKEPSLKMLCAETIGLISSNKVGLKMLFEYGDLKGAVQTMARVGSSANESTATRKRVLEAIAMIFKQDGADDGLHGICEELYRQIAPNPVNYMFMLLKQPFLDLKYSGYHLLLSLIGFGWVELDIVLCPGFIECLLDRKTETERQGRDMKYEILKKLSQSRTSRESLGLDLYEKVIQYVRQGPFYSESAVIVGYDEKD